MKLVGARAQNWLRQENPTKHLGQIWEETLGHSSLISVDLWILIKTFLGKDALLKRKTEMSCVTLLIDGPKDIDPWGREALYNETEEVNAR